jgi:hypothetical protein
MKKIQIGVIGSAADLNYSSILQKKAFQAGYWIAKRNAILIFGAEKDFDSLSAAACRGAKSSKGATVAITYGQDRTIIERNADTVIATGLSRGGGREQCLVLSCDVLIAISGGSGTLTEMAIAYQADIPVVVLEKTGGWSNKLKGKYLDERKRYKFAFAASPKEAVDQAIKLAKSDNFINRSKNILCLVGTHGNEIIGLKAFKELKDKTKNLDFFMANPKAVDKKRRFIDEDLNRVAPGKKNSRKFEVRRAFELTQLFQKYKYIIDIHGTNAATGIFTIITKPRPENFLLAGCLPNKNIVVWSSQKNNIQGSLTAFASCGVEIECGPQVSSRVQEDLLAVLKKINEAGIDLLKSDLKSKNLFMVYGRLDKKTKMKLKEFKKVKIKGEEFYPLLVNCYNNTVCYKMKKINYENFFSY